MEHLVLIFANFAVYFLLVFKFFTLFEGLLSSKKYGAWFKILIVVLNTTLMTTMALSLQITYTYPVSFVVLFFELWILFQKTFRETFAATLAVMTNIMCIRGITISAFALALGKTLYGIYSNPNLFLCVLLVSNLFEWISLFVLMHFFKVEDIRSSLDNRIQSRYIIIWSSLCVLFMFKASMVYMQKYNVSNTIFEHNNYSFLLLLSFYFLLIYTFNYYKSSKIRENLSQALGNQIKLQSAITQDSLYIAHANLTQNKILSGLEVYGEYPDSINNDYDAWFNFAKKIIHPQDFESHFKYVERNNLLKYYDNGTEPQPFEYRRLGNDHEYHWVRAVIRMFKDVETNDVHIFSYAFDIDKEVKERMTLQQSAQTDLFTGLYNKSTTEALVEEEIKKGSGILILLDVDDFKDVNDHYGHEAGDFVLKNLSNFLKEAFRKSDLIGRIGGDEFLAFIKETDDLSLAEESASKILKHMQTTKIEYFDKKIFITLSIGIVVIDDKTESFSSAYKQADTALYQAKQSGKNAYVIYNVEQHEH